MPYGQVVAEYSINGSLTASYTYGLERIQQDRGGVQSYYVVDGQGSIRQLTDQSGTVTDTYDYTAFGEILNRTGTTENSFTYTGEQWDPNAKFYYLRARWYDPSNGRFASVDPYEGDPQSPTSLHKYLYANANPINFKDPTGEWTLGGVVQAITIQSILVANNLRTAVVIGAIALRMTVRVGITNIQSMIRGQSLIPEIEEAANKIYPRLAQMVPQDHHIIPQAVSRALGIPIDQTAVRLPASVHQFITNAVADEFGIPITVQNIGPAMRRLMKAYDNAIRALIALVK